MGTRALLIVNKNDSNISNLFVSGDGYLEGFGAIIEKYVKRRHVNGYTDAFSQYNRAGNLISLIVADLVTKSTDSQNSVAKMLGNNIGDGFACGAVEIVSNVKNLIQDCDYVYTLEFNCALDKPMPPKVKVESYGFNSGWITVEEFSNLIINGLPDDEDD